MQGLQPKEPGWPHDERQHTRWKDTRLATVRTGEGERPAMTEDISPGGMQFALMGENALDLPPKMAIEVAFEEDVLEFSGQVVYAVSMEWGLLVGLRFEQQSAEIRDFLFRRYICQQAKQDEGHGAEATVRTDIDH